MKFPERFSNLPAYAFPRLRATDTIVVHLCDPNELARNKEADIASRGVLLWDTYQAARKASGFSRMARMSNMNALWSSK